MLVNVIGVRRVDITKDGDVHGYTTYVSYPQDGVDGVATQKLFLSEKMLNQNVPGQIPVPDAVIDFEYNQYGKVGSIRSITLAPPHEF